MSIHHHDHHHHHGHATGSESEVAILERAFIDGFTAADDPQAFLRLTNVPFHIHDGATTAYLVDVQIVTTCQVGVVSPGFATTELSHQPLPAELTRRDRAVIFVYRDRAGRREVAFADAMATAGTTTGANDSHSHHHHNAVSGELV